MPKYRVLTKSFINNTLHDITTDPRTGEPVYPVVEYAGKPGPNLEPLDAEAQAAWDEASKELGTKNISVSDLTRQKVAAIGASPDDFDAAQAASVAGAAATAVLMGKTVQVEGKPIVTPEGAASDAVGAEGKPQQGAEGLV